MPKGVYHRGLSDDRILLWELHNKLKVLARHRGRLFFLTREQLGGIIHRSCFYCGCAPYQRMELRRDRGGVRVGVKWLVYNGVDRVDSSLEYSIDNCVPCCGVCNRMKGSQSYADFIARVRQIAKVAEGRGYPCL